MNFHRSISDYFAAIFPGKIRKLAVNAMLGCPNRDGSIGRNGCLYCNNEAFNPRYAYRSEGSISSQLEAGIKETSNKGPFYGYLAYFQSFSNTYGKFETLVSLYEEALAFPGVKGLVIATRPDCLEPRLLDWLEQRFGNKAPENHPFLLIELGIESTLDSTLAAIGRGHDFACAESAVKELSSRGLEVGAHLIIGLPGEGPEQYLGHIRAINSLPLKTLKLHQLQIIKGTPLARMWQEGSAPVNLMSAEQYARVLVPLVRELRQDIALDRIVSEAPPSLLLAPRWGLKPGEFESLFEKILLREERKG